MGDAPNAGSVAVEVDLLHRGQALTVRGNGNGPIDAFLQALDLELCLMDFHEHAIGSGAGTQAAGYVALRSNRGPIHFGAGIDANIMKASFKAIVSAVNRCLSMDAGDLDIIEPALIAA